MTSAASTFRQFLLLLALALTGCAAPPTATPTLSPPTPTSTPTPTFTLVPPPPTTLIAAQQTPEASPVRLYDEWPSDGFPSDAAQMTVTDFENNILTIKVVYYGGCRVHTFELHAFTAFLLSYPPQGVLHLSHDAHGDNCTVQVAKFLKFDLTPLNKERNDPSEHPLLLDLYEPIGGAFAAEPLRPQIEWP